MAHRVCVLLQGSFWDSPDMARILMRRGTMMELTSIPKECYLSAVGKNVLCVNDSGRRYIRKRYVHDMYVQFFCIFQEREYSHPANPLLSAATRAMETRLR